MTTSRIQTLVDALQLRPHPEGGYYHELFRSQRTVTADQERGSRLALTTIYFLLEAGQQSRWHRVLSDEVWNYLEGEPLELFCFDPENGRLTTTGLGPYGRGVEPTLIVPAGVWQAARPLGSYTLVSCVVGPGFEFSDFSLAADDPHTAEMIRALGARAAGLL